MAKRSDKKTMAQVKAAKAGKGGKKEKGGWTPILLAFTFAMLVIVSLPTMILLFIGMLPTLVAFVVDRSPHKYSTFCVGGLNFCGVFPYLLDLWAQEHTIGAAFRGLTNVFTLLVMYGAAGFGWILFMLVPPIIGSFLAVMSERRIALLRDQQKALVDEWGELVKKVD